VISMVGCCQNVFDTTSFGTNPGASIGNLDFWPTLEKSNFEGTQFLLSKIWVLVFFGHLFLVHIIIESREFYLGVIKA
jgi:hypothetical protein